MLNRMGKSMFFFTSYAPLFFIFTVRQYDGAVMAYGPDVGKLVLLSGAFITTVLVLLTWCIFRDYDKVRGVQKTLVGRVEPAEKETLYYFITYIIPFVGIGTANWTDLVSYALIFAIIYSLYVRSGLLYLHPMLALFGFNTYKVITDKRNMVLITKKRYHGSVSAEMIEMGDGVYYEPER